MKRIVHTSIILSLVFSALVSCSDLTFNDELNQKQQNAEANNATITTAMDNKSSNSNVVESTAKQTASIQDLRDFYYNTPQLTNLDEIIAQAKNYNLESYIDYRSEDGSAESAWDAHVFISPLESTGFNGSEYTFNCDYIDIFVQRTDRSLPLELNQAHYYFFESYYNVEYYAKSNFAENHIQVCKGLYAVDPAAHFSSLEDAIEKANSLS